MSGHASAPLAAARVFQDAPSARAHIERLERELARRGLRLRPPPPAPTTCCGRGCSGCVWEGWQEAVAHWLDQAQALLAAAQAASDAR